MSIRRILRALAFSAAILTASAVQTEPAEAQAFDNPCTDWAYSEYNECLMTSEIEWLKRECDFDFYYRYVFCLVLPGLMLVLVTAI